jgi:hypothetical protein
MPREQRPIEVNVNGVIVGSLRLGTRYDEKAEMIYTKVSFEAVLSPEEIAAIVRMSRAAESMAINFASDQYELPLTAG